MMPLVPSLMAPPGTSPDLTVPMDPAAIIRMLIEDEPSFALKHPPYYNRSDWKKPKSEQIWQDARREERRHVPRVARQMETIQRLRFEVVGIFPRDAMARKAGDQDKFVSSALVDDWNLLCSILASFDFNATKKVLSRAMRTDAQLMEDFARFCREEEIIRWAETGDMPLQMAEAKVLTSYGQIASRHLPDPDNPDYPFNDTLVDPMSLYPVYGGRHGLKRVYRMMRMTVAQAYCEWGEPTAQYRTKLKDKLGSDESDFINVCEYADKRWRAAITHDGIELLPPTETDLGYVPFVIQGGSAGEPLFTDTTNADAYDRYRSGGAELGSWRTDPIDDWGLEHKLTSSISLQQERHDQFEAFMARMVTAIGDATDPAMLLTRDTLSEGRPVPKFDRRRGKVNSIGMGEQLQEMPTRTPPMEAQQMMEALQQDKMTGSIPLGMYGNQTGSQQTGNSMSVAAEQGMDHITPWSQAMELYQTRKQMMRTMNWRNFGHLSRFHGGEERPFMIPVTRPSNAQELGRALTPEVIDRMGPRVDITLTRVRIADLMMLSQIAQSAIPLGLTTVRRMAERMGEGDFDRMREEWIDEQTFQMIRTDDEARRMIEVPRYIKSMADGSTSEDERAMWMALLDFWMQRQMMQMQQQQMQQMMPQGGPSGPPQLPPGMPPGTPPELMGGMPGTNTQNFAMNPATAPGAQGGPVGRPPGPAGPIF